MKEIKTTPILMSTPMVVGIFNETKTETRRTKGLKKLKDCAELHKQADESCSWRNESMKLIQDIHNPEQWYCEYCGNGHGLIKCPYGSKGDVLWVRETFEDYMGAYNYKAGKYGLLGEKWTPSLFMPKKACRLFLEIVDVKIEKLNDISEQDAINEGVLCYEESGDYKNYGYNDKYGDDWGVLTAKESYQTLWESINGKDSWSENPYVFVVKFERIDKPVNFPA